MKQMLKPDIFQTTFLQPNKEAKSKVVTKNLVWVQNLDL